MFVLGVKLSDKMRRRVRKSVCVCVRERVCERERGCERERE